MEQGEDVLASEEGTLGGSDCREGGVREAACRNHRSGRAKKLSRKVSFPDDALLVRALDPVDPWENGKFLVFNNYDIITNLVTEKIQVYKKGFYPLD